MSRTIIAKPEPDKMTERVRLEDFNEAHKSVTQYMAQRSQDNLDGFPSRNRLAQKNTIHSHAAELLFSGRAPVPSAQKAIIEQPASLVGLFSGVQNNKSKQNSASFWATANQQGSVPAVTAGISKEHFQQGRANVSSFKEVGAATFFRDRQAFARKFIDSHKELAITPVAAPAA